MKDAFQTSSQAAMMTAKVGAKMAGSPAALEAARMAVQLRLLHCSLCQGQLVEEANLHPAEPWLLLSTAAGWKRTQAC